MGERRTVYEGDIHKCPNCGAILSPFEAKCRSCGFQLRSSADGVSGITSIKEFEARLRNISSAEDKGELIRDFCVPNTEEDIIEFFILAVSQFKCGDKYQNDWAAKLDQAIMKARLVFNDSERYEYISKMYKEAKRSKNRKQRIVIVGMFAVIGVFVTAGITLLCVGSVGKNGCLLGSGMLLASFGFVGVIFALNASMSLKSKGKGKGL